MVEIEAEIAGVEQEQWLAELIIEMTGWDPEEYSPVRTIANFENQHN